MLKSILLLALQLQPTIQAPLEPRGVAPRDTLPVRTIAGVTVVDTPIVRAAHEFSRLHSSDWVYRHVMRTWLYGALIISHNTTLKKSVDLEVHAVAVLLHDLGWDQTPNSTLISTDKRFEVDGAIAAREFIRSDKHGKKWEELRVQHVWDAIALHTQPGLYDYKEPDVKVTGTGISADFHGPSSGITQPEYDAIVQEFPNADLIPGTNQTIVWLCQTKPNTTVDTWQQAWGEHYVENYPPKGVSTWDQLIH
ncbi:unnamed protein product [Clonostachys byssicola]|uniref:HD domain-containing protein n=1 Tax=Clonostachys byssicola TaxID=160290 RepID=A0A9N9UHN0_9HYPO|nr:unnamed protein product [Clonostachys byssicola]